MFSDYSNRLYWKIALTLISILVILGVGYMFIASYTSNKYFQEVNQRLYGGIAEHLVKETKPLVNGVPDTTATHDIMHSMMVINPSAEVYLLNPEGKIIDYVVPYKTVRRERVNLEPIQQFIKDKGQCFVMGDDPKNPDETKVFSAAPIYENEKLTGYAYIILASEEQTEVASSLFSSFIMRNGLFMFLLALIGSLILGMIAVWYITRSLRRITSTVRRFKEGDLSARVPQNEKGDLVMLADTYNEMADRIESNIEEIKGVERFRRELIANVSHDLRTPLAIMQGYIETMLMKKDNMTPIDLDKYLNIVFDSSKKLSLMVTQLFEYSKLEANEIKPEKEKFFVSELAQDTAMRYQILAEKKNIDLKLDAEPGLPMVFADISLVERVIQNLLDNALKFTPENGEIKLVLKHADKGVEIRIEDSGPGIPMDEQLHIFERYTQTAVGRKKKSGAGLGLAIAKKILEIHNSTIKVTSQLNQGTAFHFQLAGVE